VRFAAAAAMVALLAACGGGKGAADGAAGASGMAGTVGGSGGGGSGGAAGNDACATAVATQPCTVEGTFCGADRCTDMCQFCNLTECRNGVWQAIEVAPVPCFSCARNGIGVECWSYTQYCEITNSSSGSVSFRCQETPAACRSTPTCGCLQSQNVSGNCMEGGAGEVTVTIAAP